MQVIFFVFVFTFFGNAFAAPREEWYDSSSSSSYSQFDDGYPFGYTGTFAGAGAAARAWPYSYGFFNPFLPWPVFRPFALKPWYKGDNVCKEIKKVDVPEEVQSWMKDDSSSYSSQSENCRGKGGSVICSKKETDGSGTKMVYTRFTCCDEYSLDPRGTGCIKNPSNDAATATDAPTSPVKSEYHNAGDRFSYVFSSSNSDTPRGSDVDKVPLQ